MTTQRLPGATPEPPLGDASRLALVARRLQAGGTLEEVARIGAAGARQVLRADLVGVRRIEQHTSTSIAVDPVPTGARDTWLATRQVRTEDRPYLARLIAEQTGHFWHDPAVHPAAPGGSGDVGVLRDFGMASAVDVPLLVNGSTWGHVIAGRRAGSGPFTAEDLARAEVVAAMLTGAVARVDLEEQVAHLVADDPLTGLGNRRVADTAAASALASGEETVIVMCDVDGLKRVNDELGHDVGDDLLRSVADVLRRVADALPGCTPARIGGDEFCLVVVGQPRVAVAEAMERTVAAFPLAHGASISYGVASTAVSGAVSARHLFRRADAAQYRAKRARARARRSAAVPLADPTVTAERVLVAASTALAAPRQGTLPRLCALAASATEVLGGAEWAVLARVGGATDDGGAEAADAPADLVVVARGGVAADRSAGTRTVVAERGDWAVEIGASRTASTGPAVLTAVEAVLVLAAREGTVGGSVVVVDRPVGARQG
ncbi:GGDEF domain-containing protein [Cellulomonas marina]|uniref:Diguanylate cyclase (GGDEF) domain-containing protein n=1 Tax=Cellulomonas marina TaxID=988821 RepID=A0A1I0YH84_9CELL|nr:sensor domain-containing diguanylate cyclase [Cellulomonas marina]SFB11523.1 diguanylate cyclase (GGDEF) domain-containing protein [Cellulomonas marina]